MKKIFLSYKFTGEVLVDLQKNLGLITDVLRKRGYTVFCSIEREEKYQASKYTVKQIMDDAIQELDKAELLFVFNNSDVRSEGMLIEMGYALAKGLPIVLAARKGININSSKGIANTLMEFESIEDLVSQISTLKL
jgi:nucleoside 2-deoxyribosyltransferase